MEQFKFWAELLIAATAAVLAIYAAFFRDPLKEAKAEMRANLDNSMIQVDLKIENIKDDIREMKQESASASQSLDALNGNFRELTGEIKGYIDRKNRRY